MMALSAHWHACYDWGEVGSRLGWGKLGRSDWAEEGHPSHATGGTCGRMHHGRMWL